MKKNSSKQIIYTGIFFDKDVISACADKVAEGKRLFKVISVPHVTLAYKPERVPCHLFGTKATVTVDGYGSDGRNEGFRVKKIECGNDELMEMFSRKDRPHITISIAMDAEAVNTADIAFEDIDEFAVTGTFGGCLGGDVLYFENIIEG